MRKITTFFKKNTPALAHAWLGQKAVLNSLTFQKIWQVVKYIISGATGGMLQVFFLYILVDRLGIWYIHGVIFSFLMSLAIVFTLQKFWTFRDFSVEKLHRQTSLYTTIAMVALGLNVLLMYILVDIVHLRHIVAQFFVVGFVGSLTFTLNKIFTFNDIQPKE